MAQHAIEIGQQSAAAGQDDALLNNVGGEFRHGLFKGNIHRVNDRADRLGQALRDLALANHDLPGHAARQIAALDFHDLALALLGQASRPDPLLDALGAVLADQNVKLTTDIADDGLVHLVATDAYGTGINDPAERQHRDLGGAAADIDNHRGGRLRPRQPATDCRRDRLLDQKNAPGHGG